MEAYKAVNVHHELEKAQLWANNKRRQCTRRFFINWLNRAVETARTITTNGTDHHTATSEYGW
jgi:hypothetical protein